MIRERSARAHIFEIESEQFLAPGRKAGQIVVLENVSIHKGPKGREIMEARGCHVLFLPVYSPDVSPIEEAFSTLKAILRRIGARTHEALQEAIAAAWLTVRAVDADGWFRLRGSSPLDELKKGSIFLLTSVTVRC